MLDGEVVASNADGSPNFARLHVRWTGRGNGQDWRPQPLVKRQVRLQVLLERFGSPAVSLSEPFEAAWRCCA